jgi:type I thyroxine 5'-deiodinase
VLNKLYDEFRDRVAFYAVYIEEAHPSDIWQMGSNIREGVVFRNPRSDGERFEVAQSCVRTLGIRFPALIDGVDNTVERLYTGWPDRLYLIDRDGRVVFKTTPGPFGFHPAGLQEALRKLAPAAGLRSQAQ